MKDPKSFVKLFDLNVPVIEHFDYYVNQLSKSEKFKNIRTLIELWNECESEIQDPWQYRKDKSEEIIEFIKSTNAYTELCYDQNLIDFPTNKSLEYLEDVNYFSVDLRSANWVALKSYDPEHINELGQDYAEFLRKFNLPEVFIHSKYLRQFIFGNVNPKKIIKVQRNLIQDIVRKYQSVLKVEGVRNDEVIFSFDSFEQIKDIFFEIDQNRYKTKIFTVSKVEDFKVHNLYNIYGELTSKELVGVDGTLFFIKLKEYITGESIDIRDLYFKHAGRLAIWSYENLKCQI